MAKLIVAILGIAAIVFAVLSYTQLQEFRTAEQQRIEQGQSDADQPEIEAERQRLQEKGMFWHVLPATIWGIIGGVLLLGSIVLYLAGRKRKRTTRLEAVTRVGRGE
ncbi:MAG: hypothetical protein ACLFUJ_01965 [Phycisphaerae bacterium]